MSSGTLPFHQYHRTSHLGDGSFGAVVTVYNNDGEEYAMKLFLENEDEEEDTTTHHRDDDDDGSDDENESVYKPSQPISIGTIREISCLRLLRGENAHPNIIAMVDIQPKANMNDEKYDDDNDEGDEENEVRGAGTSNHIGMTLPLGKYGTLASAIQKNMFLKSSKAQKVHIAHGILSAIYYLHETCGIVHRDIKCDNILLDYDTQNDRWVPILIDFSLAKPINTVMWSSSKDKVDGIITLDMENVQHTGEVGTLVYTAPEVTLLREKGFYDAKAIDMYSIGVVLLELTQNHLFTAEKYKEGLVQIQSALQALPTNVPFPDLIRQLLMTDPQSRITACHAVQHEVFHKFGIINSDSTNTTTGSISTTKHINIQTALPYDYPPVKSSGDTDGDDKLVGNDITIAVKENKPPPVQDTMYQSKAKRFKASTSKQSPTKKKYAQRMTMIDHILKELNSDHPMTRYAAFDYSIQYEQIDDSIDDVIDTKSSHKNNKNNIGSIPSQSLIDCCILAHRFNELQVLDLPSDITDLTSTTTFQNWDYDEYIDNEMTILMILDYCLFPRTLAYEY